MNPIKINRPSIIEIMSLPISGGIESTQKSTPDTIISEIKKYKAVSLMSFII